MSEVVIDPRRQSPDTLPLVVGDPFSAAPDKEQLRLLELVTGVFLEQGKWPRWPWVYESLEREGLDALTIVSSMPTEPLYSYGFIGRLGPSGPAPSQEIRVRIAGLCHVPIAQERVSYFVRLVRALGRLRREVVLDPFADSQPVVSREDVSRALGGSGPPSRVVLSMFDLEPATWNCQFLGDINSEWTLALTPGIRHFAEIDDVKGYLAATQLLLAAEVEVREPALPASPFTLPAALDFLDVVWELRFEIPLLGRPGLERSARLGAAVATGEEANASLSALAEVFRTMHVPSVPGVGGGPLDRLAPFLQTVLPGESMERVRTAVSVLRAAQEIRHGQQHSGKEVARVTSYETLGIRFPVSDWSIAWAHVQGAIAGAVDVIREEVHGSRDVKSAEVRNEDM